METDKRSALSVRYERRTRRDVVELHALKIGIEVNHPVVLRVVCVIFIGLILLSLENTYGVSMCTIGVDCYRGANNF